jgi:2-octaprenyl-6-methoxyphenol hydroxylase
MKIAIAGGGLSGLLAGVALTQLGLSPLIFEPNIDREDSRTTAVTLGSSLFLQTLGVWEELLPHAVPMQTIMVQDGARGAPCVFKAEDEGHPAFGWIMDNRLLKKVLLSRLTQPLSGSGVRVHQETEQSIVLKTTNGEQIQADYVWAADGKFSKIRAEAGIMADSKLYPVSAVVCLVRHEKPHDNKAIECFLPSGPLALLPYQGQTSALVWSLPHAAAQALVQLSPLKQAQIIEAAYPLYGQITVMDSARAWPLMRLRAREMYKRRLLLLGEAAHAMHPIAGQGWNVTVRDVAYLYGVMRDRQRLGLAPLSDSVFQDMERVRGLDTISMLWATHTLDHLFMSQQGALKMARQMGLRAVNAMPTLKKHFTKHAMGLSVIAQMGLK